MVKLFNRLRSIPADSRWCPFGSSCSRSGRSKNAALLFVRRLGQHRCVFINRMPIFPSLTQKTFFFFSNNSSLIVLDAILSLFLFQNIYWQQKGIISNDLNTCGYILCQMLTILDLVTRTCC